MSVRTISYDTVKHDDGTVVVTEVTEVTPASKKEKAIAGTILGGLIIAPFAPLVAIVAIDRYEAWREKRNESKKLKSV